MEQTKKINRSPVTTSEQDADSAVVEKQVAVQKSNDNEELLSLLKEQQKKIVELERRVMPQQTLVTNTKAPIYKIGLIGDKFVKSVYNDKNMVVDERGKAYVVQEFIVSFCGEEKPQKMSMTVYRELIKRVEAELVETIYSDECDPITGKPSVVAFKLRATNPITNVVGEYIINKDFVNS